VTFKKAFLSLVFPTFLAGVLFAVYVLAEYIKPQVLHHLGSAKIVSKEVVINTAHQKYSILTINRGSVPAFKMYIFEYSPKHFDFSIQEESDLTNFTEEDFLLINAGYFDEENQSLLMLRSGERLIQPLKDIFSGFFWIRNKQAGITHISTFKDSTNYDLVVQSAPRLLSEGIATTGVLNLDQVDTRAGVGISKTGNVIF